MSETTRVTDRGPLGALLRIGLVTLALILTVPFVLLAFAPMLLMLVPVAYVGIPFLVVAFAGETQTVTPARRVRRLHPALT